ncbi:MULTISPECIES: hypothetical protein [Bacillus]|uniref:Uncharacterized protein n=2 Tax=Bacillus thuringiensis TaxID=1428 RepID=A0AAP4Q7T3_BACTU|nr:MULTISPECIES: hypothetical protein [Bacillus]MEC0046187.1 hypothetical protein [Bacillus cereus]AFV21545.1 hypothetical protein BTB_502p02400 [Bacillus thuringiensis Bt407]EEM25420.1 hypothetical protein bthur0002_60620 [Bacillus thuringiensis Bt407]ERI01279.1 hypothetical protein BTCBT_002834 [Bacillus thuringiensis T01-328]MBN6708014.1 hypothetical protein [Bacillus thuringiensis]
MDRECWIIKTNKERYVSIPFILSSGFRSYLDEKPVWNKTRTFYTEGEAKEYLAKYLSPTDNHYVDRYSFEEGEKLIGVERVFL